MEEISKNKEVGKMEGAMTDLNGNTIKSGDIVNIIIAGNLEHKAIFRWAKGELATITELGVKFQKGGIQGYSIQALKKYVYAEASSLSI